MLYRSFSGGTCPCIKTKTHFVDMLRVTPIRFAFFRGHGLQMFEQESLQNESMEKYIWNQPLEHPKMVSTKWENTTPFFRTNPARHKMMVYAGHVPTHFMPEISRGILFPNGLTGVPSAQQTTRNHGVLKEIDSFQAMFWGECHRTNTKWPLFGDSTWHLGISWMVMMMMMMMMMVGEVNVDTSLPPGPKCHDVQPCGRSSVSQSSVKRETGCWAFTSVFFKLEMGLVEAKRHSTRDVHYTDICPCTTKYGVMIKKGTSIH